MTPDEKFLKNWLTQKLRRASYQWPPRKEAIRKARVERGKYRCVHCVDEGNETLYGPKEINADHIDPVICPETGWVDWNTYIQRLFCDTKSIQILCRHHHEIKSFLENEIRKIVKDEKNVGKSEESVE